ncbi:GAF and ANTAR domain-containing protein [Streptomyces sp. NPDC006733]|uniref:GAF and ANTAR domain-containing protein n=1 Tax=Streptomyces sp. NPDC006733 TaxID=3155460 RepID=UPI0033DB8962
MVGGHALAAVLASLHPSGDDRGLVGADPQLCAQVLTVDGIAVSAMTDTGLSELLWSTEGISARLEDLQYTLGQGPGPETALSGAPVLVPDLATVQAQRWPALLPQALALGIGAVFCLPLQTGAECLGTMTLQRAAPGRLPDARMTDARLVADTVSAVLLEGGAQQEAFAGAEQDSDFYRAVVHQASGMVSVQAGVSLTQALLRLRAHAFGHERSVTEVAEDVVARRLSFRDDQDGPDISAGEGTERP